MGSLASLIVRIGAEDTQISAALEKLVGSARRADADLSKLGSTPIGQQAIKSIENLAGNMKQITDAQQRFADKAVNAATGLETLGGASRLMSRELDQVAKTINTGLDAFRALGQEAPADLQRVSDAISKQQAALKTTATAMSGLGEAQAKTGGITNLLAGAQTALIAQLGLVAGPAALGFAAREALAYADTLTKLSDRTGIGVVALQRLGAIAIPSGNNLEEVANAVNKMQKNIAGGDNNAVDALDRLRIHMDAFRASSPDEQFISIAKAIQQIPDPAEQALLAVRLFGKAGAELLPTLKANVDALADSTVTMSAESVKALDDFGDALGQLKTSSLNIAGSMLAEFLKVAGAVRDVAKAVQEAAVAGGPAATTPELLQTQPRFASAKVGAPQPRNITPTFLGSTPLQFQSADLRAALESLTLLPGRASQSADALARVHDRMQALERAAQALGLETDDYEKKLAEVDARIIAAERDTGHLSDTQQKAILHYRALGVSVEDIGIKLGVSSLAVKAFEEELKETVARMARNTEETGKFQQELGKLIVGFDAAGKAVVGFHGLFRASFDLSGAITDLALATKGAELFSAELKRSRDALTVALATPIGLPNVRPNNKELLDAARAPGPASFSGGVGDLFHGNFGGGFSQFGNAFKSAIDPSKILNTAIGGALSGGISALVNVGIQGIGSLFKKIFGNPEKEINPLREAFVQAAGGLEALNKKAFEATGSLSLVQNLLNAKNADQFTVAENALTTAFDKQTQAVSGINGQFATLLGSAQTLGIKLPPALKTALQPLIDMGKITGDNASLFAALSGSTEVDFKKMADVAGKYGIDLASLGPQFQSARLHDSAATIINDFDLLTQGGADVGGVLYGMRGQISHIVTDSLKFGTTIPDNMKPWIEELSRSGNLVDENGKKITDLSGLKFSDPIVTEFQKIVDKLQELINKLGPPLTAAILNIPKPAPIDIGVNVHYRFDESGNDNPYASTGGWVTPRGIQRFAGGGRVLPFLPRGGDTVPAMLQPGELVLNKGQQEAVASAIGAAGIGYDDRALRAELGAQGRRHEDLIRRMPDLVAMQVKAAIAKAR